MAISISDTIVVHDDRALANIANFTTINGNAILGAGDITPATDIELIGIIRTNTGTSRALSGLTLTNYNFLAFFVENVRLLGNGNRPLTLGQTTADDVNVSDDIVDTGTALGIIQVSLQNGSAIALVVDSSVSTTDDFLAPRGRQTALRSNSTTITISNGNADTFTSGNVFVYGVFGAA